MSVSEPLKGWNLSYLKSVVRWEVVCFVLFVLVAVIK